MLLLSRGWLATGWASEPASRGDRVLRGEVVETGCYVMAGRRGENHRACAIACARAGQPIGILDPVTGLLHLALPDSSRRDGAGADTAMETLIDNLGRKVEVRGPAFERGDQRGIEIRVVHSLDPQPTPP